jgi:hypothetical protein
MSFQWRLAEVGDIDFARQLTCRNMLPYYLRHDVLWQDEAFDLAWVIRQNWIIHRDDQALGFVSLSRDARALYIRELQIDRVFKDNPARALYERMGLQVVGEDECFLRMQRDVGA